jgi:hypothetical protein
MTDLDCVTLETKMFVALQAIVSYWVPNTNEIRPVKARFNKIDILQLGPWCAYHYLLLYAVLFWDTVSINWIKSLEQVFFYRKRPLSWYSPGTGLRQATFKYRTWIKFVPFPGAHLTGRRHSRGGWKRVIRQNLVIFSWSLCFFICTTHTIQ